jgi:pyrimidine deaminase RibD-like protein
VDEKEVVIATLDPNPLVSGKGVAILADAGIVVRTGLLEKHEVAYYQHHQGALSLMDYLPILY